MFIELHKPGHAAVTINANRIELFVPAEGEQTGIMLIGFDEWLRVEESYEQVKELITECQKR